VGRRGEQRRAPLARRGGEHLRPSHVGGSPNDKDAQQSSPQKEHAVCLHSLQMYECLKRKLKAGVIRGHRTPEGGATAASVWPLALSALATKPEAFISSMTSRR